MKRWAVATGVAFVIGVIGVLRSDDTPRYHTQPSDTQYLDSVVGPFIADPRVLEALECPDEKCDGPLSFTHLMNSDLYEIFAATLPGKNPFIERKSETSLIVSTIKQDLDYIRMQGGSPGAQLDPDFLVHPKSRVQLVGIINRMDRQFHRDQRESNCGEISLIYRFAYPLSRLPVTMNIVFPAALGKLNCQTAARNWLAAIAIEPTLSPVKFAKRLMSDGPGPISHLVGRNISRIELNMQAYRKPASLDRTDFGSEATYLIRVFRWNKNIKRFEPSFLPNEINRAALICDISDSTDICKKKTRKKKELVRYLQRVDVVSSIDNGTLDIPQAMDVLSKRAVSVSPGGQHRSINQPYWNASNAIGRDQANTDREQIITDKEIDVAINETLRAGIKLNFIGDAEDFRQRLNDSTCTGCHQTRAIAGFHFPGQDQPGTPASNSVYLAGSPHFYGDQPRRMDIVRAIASSKTGKLPIEAIAVSFSARPMEKYAPALSETTLVGGWGGACLVSQNGVPSNSKRNWPCQTGLLCKQLFQSANANSIGSCVPASRHEIGDYLQTGMVKTTGWGFDSYERSTPPIAVDEYEERDTRIPNELLPKNSPSKNSYYGSHQEFYTGHRGTLFRLLQDSCDQNTRPKSECYTAKRDSLSGGFPAGMLRLSECIGLPPESTCGLVASTGFNKCIKKIGTQKFEDFNINTCFAYFTSYAGMRACNIATPCRDDYICVKSIDPAPATNMQKLHLERLLRLQDPSSTNPWTRINNEKGKTPYDINDFGQQRPDDAWIKRNDTRGICIPPYFVFQFRSDNHPPFPVDFSPKGQKQRWLFYEKEGEL